MNHRRGLRALGLSILAALGLMAFAAGGVQAQSFLVQELTAPWSNVPVTGAGEDPLKEYLEILKLNLKLSCHTVSASGTVNSNGHGHAQLHFSNCLVTDTSGATVECTISPFLANVLILVILHTDKKPYVLFEPLDGLTFAEVKASGEFCTLPKTATVKGSVVASISNPDADDVTKLLSTKGMLTLFTGDKLLYGSHEGHLFADANVSLTGTHVGDTWGAT